VEKKQIKKEEGKGLEKSVRGEDEKRESEWEGERSRDSLAEFFF